MKLHNFERKPNSYFGKQHLTMSLNSSNSCRCQNKWDKHYSPSTSHLNHAQNTTMPRIKVENIK